MGEIEQANPKLAEFYKRLLQIQSEAEQHAGAPKLGSSKVISERVEQGLPLLAFADLDLDWSLVQTVLAQVTRLFADYPELFGPLPRDLWGAGSELLLQELAKAWFEGSPLPDTRFDISKVLLRNIIQATLKPFLVSYSKALLSKVDQERWRRGYCPICGGNPDFAFLDKERGARWLLCSRCDAQWLFQRLECPYCGNHDQNALSYFTDDKGLYRLYVCEQCRRYLKAIDLRQASDEVALPLERVFTLDIDIQAREYGYAAA